MENLRGSCAADRSQPSNSNFHHGDTEFTEYFLIVSLSPCSPCFRGEFELAASFRLSHYREYGLGRPIGCVASRITGFQAPPHVEKVFHHGAARRSIWNDAAQLVANALWREICLHQLGHDI